MARITATTEGRTGTLLVTVDTLWSERRLMGIGDTAARAAFVIGKDGVVKYAEQTPTPKDLPNFGAIKAAQLGYKGPTQRIVAYWLEHDSQLNVETVELARQIKRLKHQYDELARNAAREAEARRAE